jgi:hypothetical protein
MIRQVYDLTLHAVATRSAHGAAAIANSSGARCRAEGDEPTSFRCLTVLQAASFFNDSRVAGTARCSNRVRVTAAAGAATSAGQGVWIQGFTTRRKEDGSFQPTACGRWSMIRRLSDFALSGTIEVQ